MSSPAEADYAPKDGQDANKQILFRFCSDCSNLLFPREDKAENKLLFACRTCSFTEEAPSACVMRHEIASTVGATAGVTAEVAQDPTVGLSDPSPQNSAQRAAHNVAYFVPEEKDKEVTCCTMCGQDIMCNVCGEDWAPGYMLEAEDEPSHVEPPFYMDHDYDVYDDDFFDDEDMEDLPRIQKQCSCGENEAVFFQSQQRTLITGMALYYVCCGCGKVTHTS